MKIFLDTIGCRLNQAEIERMAWQFRAAGHRLVAEAEDADIAVVNTCAVTAQAAVDSRKLLRRAKRAGVDTVVATGCWATIAPEEAAELSQRVVLNAAKENLVSDFLNIPAESFADEPFKRVPLPGLRSRTRAFIKVQDGCDNQCSFCITTVARGAGRSRPLKDILVDIKAALAGGAQEVVLTGVHLGSWREQKGRYSQLSVLIRAILNETSVPRLRLSSLEPWELETELFALWRNPRLMRHLHLPLQAGSDSVLRRMRRNTSRDKFRALVLAARDVMPDAAITTDLIAGFPGETEAEFAETLAYVQEIGFADGHIFTYSPRAGTPAAQMPGQLEKSVRKARNARLRAVFTAMSAAYRQQFLGKTTAVLWESSQSTGDAGFLMQGLTGNYLRVRAMASQPRRNQIDQVRLLQAADDLLTGEII